MRHPPDDDQVVRGLVQWGDDHDAVRAMILTSTRADPDAPLDPFSDFDVIVAVADVRPFYEDRAWLEHFGAVLVVYRDPIRAEAGGERFAYITQYQSGLKIDFTLWSTGILSRLSQGAELPDDLDVGYAILLDKDNLTRELTPPTYMAYVLRPPSEATYLKVVEEFLHEATYVAKHLWRDDLLPAKYNLDHAMKQVNLRRMLEWRLETDHGWSVPVRAYGKGLKERLPTSTWLELERTYARGGIEDNWDALFRTVDLFRRIATEVGDRLGFEYPNDLDARVIEYLGEVRKLRRRGA